MVGFLWLLQVFGVPLSWRKVKGGRTYTWIGYEVSLEGWALGVSATRADWAITWMTRVLDNNRVLMRELREALGRLVFVDGALTWDKPFLAPLFTCLPIFIGLASA